MALYPTALRLGEGSDVANRDDLALDRAVNGSPKVRAYYSARKREFTVRHNYVTESDRDTLLTFYDTNRLLEITFTWLDGVTYTCVFAAPPKTTPQLGGVWLLETRLAEV